MGIFLDTSFLIPLLIKHLNTIIAQEILSELEEPGVISPTVIDETIFVGCRLMAK